MQLYLYFYWQHSSCCTGGTYVVSLSLFLCRFDAARLVPSSLPCLNHGCSAFCVYQRRGTFCDPVFVVGRGIKGCNASKTFGTIWEQSTAAMECLWMEWKIKKWSHKCYAWQRSQTTEYTAITDDNTEHACDMVLLDRWVTIDEMVHVLQVSHGSAYEIMHNNLEFHKVCKMGPKTTHRGA